MKTAGLLGLNFLEGMQGDAMNALLCVFGHNLRKILAWITALLCLLPGHARAVFKVILLRLEAVLFPQPTPDGRLK